MPVKDDGMADRKENEMQELQSIEWIRGLLGSDSGKISIPNFCEKTGLLRPLRHLLSNEDFNNLPNGIYFNEIGNGTGNQNSPLDHHYGILLCIAFDNQYMVQISIKYTGGILSRGTIYGKEGWSNWV